MVLSKEARELVISSQINVIANSFEKQCEAVQALAAFIQAEAFEKIAESLERLANAQERIRG